jgi:ABC-type nitrate/sulfonate/bicarbonate transport system permease component
MDVDGVALLAKVALPAALPDIATGLRVGFGLSFGILVAAELIAAERGMGFLVMQSRQIGELGVAVFGILLIGIVSLVSDAALAAGLRRLIKGGLRHQP